MAYPHQAVGELDRASALREQPSPASPAAAAFTQRELRQALACFATGVTVVTAWGADGRPVGVTVNSFNSVSLDPPLVLWCLSRRSGSLAAFSRATRYAINILSDAQAGTAERFASKDMDRWASVAFRPGRHGSPVLDGAAAVLECASRRLYEEGDHLMFVGEVEHCSRSAEALPLIFCAGRYLARPAG
ncbi:flavin reductase family protein [Aquabacterium sp. A7-Y]|uniref:flavin reductase family protein n=1 Tax=Aquabacterium sp. A7-Y TaxID=1349605 RepID=UPI00223DEF5D|nr:flavin reductase family protein [Aquabacterium sp. A7-Y]MCW7536889.1 flavin reductase family protein [Aquabacterium sp. A7-Y]